jgi:hypothetical protein
MRTVFLGFAFREMDRDLVDYIERLLESHGLKATTGKALGGEALNEAVQARIKNADAFVGLLTRRDQIANGGWTTHDWIKDELRYARGQGQSAIALVETDVAIGGMEQPQEHIQLDRAAPLEAFLRLSETLAEWKRKAGRTLRVRLQPDDIAELVTAEANGVTCQYRFVDDRGQPTAYMNGRVSEEAGGIVLYVDGVGDQHHIQVKIEAANRVWRSPVEPQLMQITLKPRVGV